MSTQQSFKNYRTALRDSSPPCLPYLGVHLSDLVFIEDGNADTGIITLSLVYSFILILLLLQLMGKLMSENAS